MKTVLLIGADGKRLGDYTIEDARELAKKEGKDLQLVSAKNNVYKIADIGKQRYQAKQRKKQQAQQKRTHKIKEVQIRPLIEQHDLDVKSRRVLGFLSKGLKTKVVMRFKGRQMANTKSAERKMSDFVAQFTEQELATIDRPPKFEGRNLVVFLTPSKDKK